MNMSIFGEAVDKALVHKSSPENVFVANLRRALPIQLSEDEYQFLYELMNDEEKRIFEFSYLPSLSGLIVDSRLEKPGNFRIIRDCPESIPIDLVKKCFKENCLHKKDLYFIRNFYRKDYETGCYILKKLMDDLDIIQLRRILNFDYYFLTENEKAMLSKYIEKFQINRDQNNFFGSMIIDTSHKFFFEHKIDHVPGMMLMESIRQFLIAISHKYGAVPLDYHFILSEVSMKFDNYIELNLPVIIKAEVKEIKKYPDSIWSNVHFQTEVFQNGEKCSYAEFKTAILKKQVFQRVRKKRKQTFVAKPWFLLRETLRYKFILKSYDTKIQLEIILISETGVMCKVAKNKETVHSDNNMEFYAYFENIALISGKATLSKISEDNEYDMVQVNFIEIQSEDLHHLRMVIDFYGFLKENTEDRFLGVAQTTLV